MMWAVDPPWWFHFLRASSRSQIEMLWGYYKVRGCLTLNMMTIPSWHFHFLKRLIPCSSWGQRCLLMFVQISSSSTFRAENFDCKYAAWMSVCISNALFDSHVLYVRGKAQSIWQSDSCTRVGPDCGSKDPFLHIFSVPFCFVLQMSSEVWPWRQPVGVADVFNGTWFVSWWRDKHGEEIKTPGFLPQSPAFILLPHAVATQGHWSRVAQN